ncbi:MAG: hypothetical protein Q9M40_07095 [Sulfurimonas sp.]|nr:hypothetical protein [Sulfurimonas sp.]
MAITDELASIYDIFLEKGMLKLEELQAKTGMEDEYLAVASAKIIDGAMVNAVNAISVLKKNALIDKQIDTEDKKALDIVSTTTVRNAQSSKDLLVKAEQIKMSVKQQATEDKKALDIVSTTTVRNAQSSKDLLVKAEQIKMSVKQQAKVHADTLFTDEQRLQLGISVTYNNRLKVFQDYGDTLGNIGLGGFVIPSSMWTTYFNMADDIYVNYGAIPVAKNITYPTTTTLVKA